MMKLFCLNIFRFLYTTSFISAVLSFNQRPINMQEVREPRLFELLAETRDCNIFSELIMQFPDYVHLFQQKDQHITVLVPNDAAFQQCKVKPWAIEYKNGVAVKSTDIVHITEQQAQDNILKFVERHIITSSPIEWNNEYKTIDGTDVHVIKKEEEIYINESIHVLCRKKASNGEMWVLNATLSTPSIRE
ncbi:cell surface fascilin domain protein, implicated in adhesion Mug57 [Schizosaccharomyces pombe]|uniref:FAS1 domain-containing protein mug57 n=1 Tax=Schizosaccharomyces pombe (strain 972 / ATCC 24843) TaxID=284812 RepID=YFAS1_SCHPO|nr:protein mug57 [Schizosaccharomyces pombe]Q9Y801.2 RecName: Full=FAS1 domain-containing protein mug57; AltName: Full=Meiotically up-regulated gene 57 protein; Flags: Precursor [Schizosaccharomyces pombe 972h-]CAB46763.2 meiotically upregulated gene Mug57 [Schizosaccharomyces pombe]|eukprot:NP_595399.2 protein mug57 [Schizosaccharomyces pombe]